MVPYSTSGAQELLCFCLPQSLLFNQETKLDPSAQFPPQENATSLSLQASFPVRLSDLYARDLREGDFC